MAASTPGSERSRSGEKQSARKKRKRIPISLDLTPLVDIAFLLLTFFMATGVLLQPQVMQMAIPPDDRDAIVPKSSLLNLYLTNGAELYYTIDDMQQPERLQPEDVRNLAVSLNMKHRNALVTALRVMPGARYGAVIDILDELNLAEIDITAQLALGGIERERRFALASLSPEEWMAVMQN